jgi:hypothetical protein
MGYPIPNIPKVPRPPNTMGHRTRSQWSNRQETGSTSYTSERGGVAYTPSRSPKGISPEHDFPIKRVKKMAGILLTLLLLWILFKSLGSLLFG